MSGSNILILSLIILFCVCGTTALLVNAHSKSRIPIVVFTASGIAVIVFAVLILLSGNNSPQKEVKDHIPITEFSESANKNDRKTHKSETQPPQSAEKSDDDIVYITKHGSKYHFSLDCGPYEFYECTLREAKERGLEPCQNCTH